MGAPSRSSRRRGALLGILACVALAGVDAAPASGASGLGPRVEALLVLRHPAGLARFVRRVSNPHSPHYRDYSGRRPPRSPLRRLPLDPTQGAPLAVGPRPRRRDRPDGHVRAGRDADGAWPAPARRRFETGTFGAERRGRRPGSSPAGPRPRGRASRLVGHPARRLRFRERASGAVQPRGLDSAAPAPARIRAGSDRHPSGMRRGPQRGLHGARLGLHAEPVPDRLRSRQASLGRPPRARNAGFLRRDRRVQAQRREDLRRLLRVHRPADPRPSGRRPGPLAERRDDPRPRDVLGRGAAGRIHGRLRGLLLGGRHPGDQRRRPGASRTPPRRDLDLARGLRAALRRGPRLRRGLQQRVRGRGGSRDLDPGGRRRPGLEHVHRGNDGVGAAGHKRCPPPRPM